MARSFIVVVAVLLSLTPVRTFAQGRVTALQGVNVVTVKASIVAPPETLPNGFTEGRLQTLVQGSEIREAGHEAEHQRGVLGGAVQPHQLVLADVETPSDG